MEEQEFSKIFKSLVYIEKGKVLYVIKTGISIKIDENKKEITLYKEENCLSEVSSRSKGKFRKIKYRGEPNIEGFYRLIGVPIDTKNGLKVPLLQYIHIKLENSFGNYIKETASEMIFYKPFEGKIIKGDLHLDVKRVKNWREFLKAVNELWNMISDFRLPV